MVFITSVLFFLLLFSFVFVLNVDEKQVCLFFFLATCPVTESHDINAVCGSVWFFFPQTISLLVFVSGGLGKKGPFLILSPLSVMENWRKELERCGWPAESMTNGPETRRIKSPACVCSLQLRPVAERPVLQRRQGETCGASEGNRQPDLHRPAHHV